MLYLWQDPRYTNVFLCCTGIVYTVDGDLYAALHPTVPVHNKMPHDQSLFSLMRKCGLRAADMVQVGGQQPVVFPPDLV